MNPKVLILGGGFAGTKLATNLVALGHEVTLVSKTEYFEVAIVNATSLVEPSITDHSLVPYKALKPHGRFIQGEVVKLTDTQATLADGTVLDFDYAAICTGSDYAVGKSSKAITLQDRIAEVQALNQRVAAASSVLIVGGGPLGVELAGEIVQDYPGKQVTLVHSGERLLPALPPKLGNAAAKWLQEHGCKLLLNDKLTIPAGKPAWSGTMPEGYSGTTAAGVEVSADVLLMATGMTVNTGFMRAGLADTLDDAGRIKVDKHLRVVGHPNLFALGDVTDVPEDKLAFLAARHGELAAKNLHMLLQARSQGEAAVAAAEKKLKVWKPYMGFPVSFVSLGRRFGVARIGPFSFVGWLPTQIKSKDMKPGIQLHTKQLLAIS